MSVYGSHFVSIAGSKEYVSKNTSFFPFILGIKVKLVRLNI